MQNAESIGDGVRLENTVACILRKELDYVRDVHGNDTSLHFVKNKEGEEIDFAVSIDHEVSVFFEVKLSDG